MRFYGADYDCLVSYYNGECDSSYNGYAVFRSNGGSMCHGFARTFPLYPVVSEDDLNKLKKIRNKYKTKGWWKRKLKKMFESKEITELNDPT